MFWEDIIFDTTFIDNAYSQNILFQITVHVMSIKRENISLQCYFFSNGRFKSACKEYVELNVKFTSEIIILCLKPNNIFII